jgi:1-acyl-sn-glycerol-3-phosphate acyltransferase
VGAALGRVKLLSRIAACVAAAVPTTLVFPVPVTMLFGHRFGREDRVRRMHAIRAWASFCRRRIVRINLSVEGEQFLPQPSRGHMFVCNHQSWADILVLMEALDTGAFLAKSFVKWLPVLGWGTYACGSVFVDRSNQTSRQHAMNEILRMCAESTAVVVFPEGTRSEDGELRARWYPAAIRAAHAHGLRIVPVGIDGTFGVVPKSMDRINLNRPVAVTIGAAMDPSELADSRAFAEAVWTRVGELFAESRGRVRAAAGAQPVRVGVSAADPPPAR